MKRLIKYNFVHCPLKGVFVSNGPWLLQLGAGKHAHSHRAAPPVKPALLSCCVSAAIVKGHAANNLQYSWLWYSSLLAGWVDWTEMAVYNPWDRAWKYNDMLAWVKGPALHGKRADWSACIIKEKKSNVSKFYLNKEIKASPLIWEVPIIWINSSTMNSQNNWCLWYLLSWKWKWDTITLHCFCFTLTFWQPG